MKFLGYEVNKAKSTAVKQKTVGVVGLKTASGKVNEEFIYELQWPQAGKVYQEMASNDAIVGGCLYLIETLIRQAKWHVKAASTDPGDVEAATFLESCMFDMQTQTWDDFICEALSMLPYGFSFHEISYKVRRGPLEKDPKYKSNYTDGKFGWQELSGRSQATLSDWLFDESTGKVTHFVQDPSLVGSQAPIAEIPVEGNLLFRTKASRGNPEGWSILRRAYRSWYFKRYIEELEGVGVERCLAGIPVLQPSEDTPLFDPDNEDMRKLLNWSQQLVNDLRQDRNHGVIIPPGWTLELLSAKGNTAALNTDTIIRRHENRIAMSMLSDVVMMGGDRTGSFALAETKQSLLISSLQTIIGSICAVLNASAVPALFALNNWTLEKLPKIVADDIQPITVKEVALLMRSIKTDMSKNQTLFNYLLSLIQAPELSDEEYNALMGSQEVSNEAGNADGAGDGEIDPVDNDLKQVDEAYTGMEGE